MDYRLDANDKEIVNFLINSSNFSSENLLENIDKDTTDEKELVKLLPSIIINMQKKNKIEYLIKLFEILYENKQNSINSFNLKIIANSIIKYFSNSKYNTNFPRNLFTGYFLGYLIKENRFFNNYRGLNYSILAILLHSKQTIDYFNITILPNYVRFYEKFIDRLYNIVNRDILTYSNISSLLVTRSINIISLVSDYIEIDSSCEKLINKATKLYMLIYSSTCETISLNNESKKIYQHISSRFNIKNSNYNPILKQIDEDVSLHFKTINILRHNRHLSNSIIDKIKNFDIEDSNHPEYDDLIRILPYTMNNKLFLGIDYADYIKKCNSYAPKILDSEKINIHHKCKFVLETDLNLYNESIERLVKLFINIEPFSPDSGFNDKNKVRNRIISIILDLDKLDALSNIDNKIFREFNTLFTSHINEIMVKIIKFKKELSSIHNYRSTNISQLLLIKYILYLLKSVNLLIKFKQLDKNKLDNHFYYKQSELLFSILKYSISGDLYNDISSKDKKPVNMFLEASCSDIIKNIYENIYEFIDYFSNNTSYINEIANNSNFYDKSDLDNTIKNYGDIKFTNGKTIKQVLEKYRELVEIKMKAIEDNKESYSKEIPTKFMDPILFSVINEPFEVPEVKQILDKYTIINHLTFSETNPFTNKELTKEQLFEYNKEPEVKERISKFIDEFNKWKLDHKI